MITTGTPPAYVLRESWEYGEWAYIGAPYNCGEWSPSPATIKDGQRFTQQQECDRTRQRVISIYNHWSDGKKSLKMQYTDDQSDGIITDRAAIGTKPYITGQTNSATSWANSGSHYGCGTWSPNPNTVDKGKTFTQRSSCKQNQKRTVSIFDLWSDGRKVLKSTNVETKTVSSNQSRSAKGTKTVSASGRWMKVSGYSYGAGGNASAGQPCSPIGSYGKGPTGQGGQSGGQPISFKYKCS
ncbi:hypothetical protein OTK49_02575 [Vibrio coralliirubri]|uniref:hypothetical protein n=1 Tax=Vibrio coralliirubri TaxID=1516159 RepID=UPI0022832FB2|nr:hypothetical protein [Vibrio coralliirubri]MCY9861402.1 hypothetical protein [Vibrio coralliirubri]